MAIINVKREESGLLQPVFQILHPRTHDFSEKDQVRIFFTKPLKLWCHGLIPDMAFVLEVAPYCPRAPEQAGPIDPRKPPWPIVAPYVRGVRAVKLFGNNYVRTGEYFRIAAQSFYVVVGKL